MELEVQIAVNFLIGYLVNKLPRRRVQLFGEELISKLTKKFDGHWYPEKPSKGSGYRCLLITDSLDPVLSSAAKESGLNLKDVKANLPDKLCLWIDPREVSFRIGEQGTVKTIYKAEKKTEEICDETARWVNLLNGHNNRSSPKLSPVSYRSRSPPNMAGRSSPVLTSPSHTSSSPPFYNSTFSQYGSWSTADELSVYKFRPNRSSPTPLSPSAKEFTYHRPSNSEENLGYGVAQAKRGLDSTRGALVSSPFFDWFNYSEFGNFNASQLPIMA